MVKVTLGLLAVVLATAYAARLAVDAAVNAGGGAASEPWAQNRMEFVAWNGEKWTAWVRDDVFEQRPENEERWSRHSNVSLAFVDWRGRPWQAKIDGDAFLLANRGDWNDSVERSIAIRYVDWNGRHQLRTVAQLQR
jgi:hypothetical protein